MWRRYLAQACVLFIIVPMLPGCGEGEGETFEFHCPRCDEQVTWKSYGDFVFGAVGNDATARRLVSQCGWTVQGGHNGGIGETLQVTSCGTQGVIFVWAYNSFQACRLAAGWGGHTDRGMRIGDSVGALLAAYPHFRKVSESSYVLNEDDIAVEANFDARGALKELIVGNFFRR